MGVVTVAEAARILGISKTAVRKLIRHGRLSEIGRSKTMILLDRDAVEVLASTKRRRGRAWEPATAWAALDLLSGGHADWLDAATRARLRGRLRTYTVDDVRQLARTRASITRWSGPEDARTAAASQLVRTGETALADPGLASALGLTCHQPVYLDGYLQAGSASEVALELGLVPDPAGTVILREATHRGGLSGPVAPVAAVALDLMGHPLEQLASASGHAFQRMLGAL